MGGSRIVKNWNFIVIHNEDNAKHNERAKEKKDVFKNLASK